MSTCRYSCKAWVSVSPQRPYIIENSVPSNVRSCVQQKTGRCDGLDVAEAVHNLWRDVQSDSALDPAVGEGRLQIAPDRGVLLSAMRLVLVARA